MRIGAVSPFLAASASVSTAGWPVASSPRLAAVVPTGPGQRRSLWAMQSRLETLVLSGAYGAGKSSVAVEIADMLEARGAPFAAIDLDWLTWANVPGADHGELGLLVSNLGAIVANYRAAGVRLFVLAYAVADLATLEAIRSVMAMPVRLVRLTLPEAMIEERLGGSPTSGRADDLVRARQWIAQGIGVGFEDVEVDNVGLLRETALRVLTAIGWE
jgi:hypothetical protein